MRSTHLINYILFALIATILIAVSPVSALVAADGKDIQSHPHSPSSNSIPPEEVDALTNGERFRRGLPPATPARFARRSFGGVHRRVPISGGTPVRRGPIPSAG